MSLAMKLAIGLLFISLSSASCASIVTGSSDSVKISSAPEGANFETNTGHKGTTPATITVADKETLQIRCWMNGYQDASVSLSPRMSGWFLGNLILGGLVGIVIDLASGNWRTHDDEISVRMIPVVASAPAAAAPAPTPPVAPQN